MVRRMLRVGPAVALAALSLSCLAPEDPYPRDNPYDPNFGNFLLLADVDGQGVVTLSWAPPADRQAGDRAVVFVDDELDGDFTERTEVDLEDAEYVDVGYPLGGMAVRDYLVGVRRAGHPVPGTSNWVRAQR